jgi:hypothetical protein
MAVPTFGTPYRPGRSGAPCSLLLGTESAPAASDTADVDAVVLLLWAVGIAALQHDIIID